MSALVPVTFRFPGKLIPMARQVAVAGSFNDWNPTTHLMTRTASGDWATTINVPTGRLVYYFWVDASMWLDPNDDGRVPNAWGSEYSVRYVHPDTSPSRARSA